MLTVMMRRFEYMPISKMLVIRFFDFLKKRRFAKAESVLIQIRQKINETEWNSGYLNALDGVLLANKTNDSYSFVTNADFSDEKTLKKSRKEFLNQYKNKINSDFDRGFFAAWADYMLITLRELKKLKTEQPPTKLVDN